MKHKALAKTQGKAPAARVPMRRHSGRISPCVVQPSLRVGAVNDPAEREAETMAARVVGASAPAMASSPSMVAGGGADAESAKAAPLRRSAENQPNLDELTAPPPPAEHADFDLPATQDVDTGGLDAADMAELESGKPEDTGGDAPLMEARVAHAPTAKVGRMGGKAPSDVAALVANPGPGRPLPSGLRDRVEPHFGTSFEDVRLHDKPADRQASARIGARAFTHRNHIWLGEGESPTNTRLMAHELTHVVQQTQGNTALPLYREIAQREPIRREAEEDEGYIEGWIEDKARYVPGYTLATVILGKTLVSGRKVLKTATNLLGGIFGLHPLGTVLFDKLRETRMVEEAFTWVQTRLGELNLTWSRVRGLIDRVLDLNPVTDGLNDVIAIFKPITNDLLTFAVDVGKKVLEFAVRGALKLAGPYADRVWAIIEQARDVLHLIIENPLGFAMNLIKAVVGGFRKFGVNILTHLKNGLLGWLFGAIAGAGITLPERLDFKGLMSLVMQILGLTYANFRKILVKQLGPSGEKKVTMIEKSVEIVKILLTEGFAGIWQKMLEMIESFKETLIGGISSMVITTVVKAGISWLAGLSNPVGAIVKVVLAIYDLIVAFLERLDQIMEVAQSIFSSVGAIARGQTEAAANFVEQTVGRTVPVVISFLAAALGLGGISAKIKGVIDKLQKPVLRAMDKLVGFIVKKAKKLFAKLIGKLNGKRKLPSVGFNIGKKAHRIFADAKDKRRIEIKIASTPYSLEIVDRYNAEELKKFSDIEDKKAEEIAKKIEEAGGDALVQTKDDEDKIDLSSEKVNQRPRFNALLKDLERVKNDIQTAQQGIETTPYLIEDTTDKPPLFRLAQPRDDEFEGMTNSYDELEAAAAQDMKGAAGQPRSQFYDLDHIIEKQYPQVVLENLHLITEPKSRSKKAIGPEGREERNEKYNKNRPAGTPKRAKTSVYRTGSPPPLGKLGDDISKGDLQNDGSNEMQSLKSVGRDARHFPAIAVFKKNHIKNKVRPSFEPVKIIEGALALKKADRPAFVISELRKQFDHEVKLLRTKLAEDTMILPALRAKTEEGLKVAETINDKIYTFGAGQMTPAPAPETEAEARRKASEEGEQKFGPTDSPMFGNTEHKVPNFAEEEGKGQKYKAGDASADGYLESDHVIDKIWPLTAKKALLLNDETRGRLNTYVDARLKKDGKSMNQKQAKRLRDLNSVKMFEKDWKVGSYTEYSGFAIPLQTNLAKRVTAATKSDASAVNARLTPARNKAISPLVDYVLNNGATDRIDVARGLIAKQIKHHFIHQSKKHEEAIAQEYRNELSTVPAQHPRVLQMAAKQTMADIVRNVLTSLNKARQKTDTLFDRGTYDGT